MKTTNLVSFRSFCDDTEIMWYLGLSQAFRWKSKSSEISVLTGSVVPDTLNEAYCLHLQGWDKRLTTLQLPGPEDDALHSSKTRQQLTRHNIPEDLELNTESNYCLLPPSHTVSLGWFTCYQLLILFSGVVSIIKTM